MDDCEITTDRLLGGAVMLLQPRRGHRAGTDAVLLAMLARVEAGDRIADLGSASGAVGLILAHRVPDAHLTFVDRNPDLLALCHRNAALNGIEDRASVVEADILGGLQALPDGSADLVATNPPFFDAGSHGSPDPGRRAAHVMAEGGLAAWLGAAARLLRHRGRLALIHRADALARCLALLGSGFGSVEIVPIHPRTEAPASRIVLRAVKGGRAPLRLQPPLVLHGPDGRFTAEAAALHRGVAPT